MAGHLNLGPRLQTFATVVPLTLLLLYIHPPTLALTILAIAIDEYHRCIRQLPNAILPLKPTPTNPTQPAPAATQKAAPYTTGSRAFHVACSLLIGCGALYGHMTLTGAVLGVNAWILIHSLIVNSNTIRPLTTAACVMIFDLFGHVYLSYLWSHALLYLRLPHTSPLAPFPITLVCYVIVCTVAGENGALFVGRAIGRTKLAPSISPNKSVEGAVAQLLTTLVVSLLYCSVWMPDEVTLHDAVLLGLLTGVMGIIGDLLESLLKRAVNVKDVGTLLPGTGGMLDRVDGLTLVFPVVYYYVRLRYDAWE